MAKSNKVREAPPARNHYRVVVQAGIYTFTVYVNATTAESAGFMAIGELRHLKPAMQFEKCHVCDVDRIEPPRPKLKPPPCPASSTCRCATSWKG